MNRTRLICFAILASSCSSYAASFDPKLFAEMRWRNIGPHRGGRTRAVSGVAEEPNVLYMGVCNGGVWKTTDYGRTWNPIFDKEPTGSIGAIAVAPSNPNIIYVGSGEGLLRPDLSVGDGIYKSVDAGKTWTHLGLRDGQQIPQIAVDPHDPNRLFVAVLGHPYGPNQERGVFRSTNGGLTFEKVLYKDENTGANDVQIDPFNSGIIYASLWEARQGPWENAAWAGAAGGIQKSVDGGKTWQQLKGGLPTGDDGILQAVLAISPSQPKRLYATVATARTIGIYRSDDAGENWTKTTTDVRPAARIGGGDAPVLTVDPKNSDIVYSASVVTWKSTDAGKTWTGIRGAPGGDDYQRMWINPNHPNVFIIAGDQGGIVTVNGGETFSSWYNQPTAQLYHVAADNAFPYRVCSGQQESGSVCVNTRSMDGELNFRDWHPVHVEEYGFAAPDPLDPDIVFGGKVTKYNRRTGQVQNVSPVPVRPADFRTVRTAPLLFSPLDPHLLFFAANTVWKTRDGGNSWTKISPDLTRPTWEIPASVGKYRTAPTAQATQRGVVYSLGPSPLDVNRIWAGTDDGLIQMTADGGVHWNNVTPPQITAFMKVAIIDAGHFDRGTAYAAVNTLRLDDMRPHIFRTHDNGKNWTEINTGIPDGAPVDVVREDPKRKGLLYAGTERQVYVSFDDGGQWQSLRLNMPATSIRDLLIKDDDLIAATHGRAFWILDDVTPLRQIESSVASAPAYLFKPQTAIRVRWDTNSDTPIPPDEPSGENPPDGAIIDYYLGTGDAAMLEVLDGTGKMVRRYSSADLIEPVDPMLAIPKYWVRPALPLSAEAGMHRFLWDMHFTPLLQGRANFPSAAVPFNTVPAASSPWVMPGVYTIKLTVADKAYTQTLTVKMDPRVKTSLQDLGLQFRLSKQLYDDAVVAATAAEQIRAIRAQLTKVKSQAGVLSGLIDALDKKAGALQGAGAGRGGGGRGGPAGPMTLGTASGALSQLMTQVQESDVVPTTQLTAAIALRRTEMARLMQEWSALKTKDLAALNLQLKSANLPEVTNTQQH